MKKILKKINPIGVSIIFEINYQFGPATNKREVLNFNNEKYIYQLKRNNLEIISSNESISCGENIENFKENILTSSLKFIDNVMKTPNSNEKISKILNKKYSTIENFYNMNKNEIDWQINNIVENLINEFLNFKYSPRIMFKIVSKQFNLYIDTFLKFNFEIEIG